MRLTWRVVQACVIGMRMMMAMAARSVGMPFVGARLGLKSTTAGSGRHPEPGDHGIKHVIMAIGHRLAGYLQRHVTIA